MTKADELQMKKSRTHKFSQRSRISKVGNEPISFIINLGNIRIIFQRVQFGGGNSKTALNNDMKQVKQQSTDYHDVPNGEIKLQTPN